MERGKSSLSPTLKCHMCTDNGRVLPRDKFSREALKNAGRRTFVACKECTLRRDGLRARFEDKDSKGRKYLKSKFICSCKRHIHSDSNEKCALNQATGVWPGSDFPGVLNISIEDVVFSNRMPQISNYSWWCKLWCRRLLAPSYIFTGS